MQRTSSSMKLLAALASVFLAGMAATMPASAQTCSPALVAGSYAASDDGTIIPLLGGVTSRASVGQINLDAAGNLSGTSTASLGGVIGTNNFTGTYVVNPDCTGTMNLQQPGATATFAVVWDSNGSHFRFIFTSLASAAGLSTPTVIHGDATKKFP